MKKILFACVIAILSLSVIPVRAMETNTYVGTAQYSSIFSMPLTTFRAGDFTAHVVWTPKNTKVIYAFEVFHYTDLAYPYASRDMSNDCYKATYQKQDLPAGNWTCYLPNAPAGYYLVNFYPYSGGQVTFTLTITAETNP